MRKDSSGLSKTLFQQYGVNLPPLSCSPQNIPRVNNQHKSMDSQQKQNTYNAHFINSCPFYKLFAYMNHSSLVTVHLIVGDYITVLWCSQHAPRPNIIAQEGPIAQVCVSWLWYKHDQLLVAIVECGRRAKSGLILSINKS